MSEVNQQRASRQRRRSGGAEVSRPRILVTGASGFLGKHLVAQLCREHSSQDVRALARRTTLALERLDADICVGDVCVPDDCKRAVLGVREVYHVAGMVSRDADDAPLMYKVHVDGTRALLRAAAEAGVRRVVVVSTSGTVAVSKDADEVSNEDSPCRREVVANWPYYLSKIYQEETALELGDELDLDVVVANPSLLLGPGDERGSSTGDVEKIMNSQMPIIPKGGGVAFVDARDAAAGCILAMRHGETGERYLLSAQNLTLESFCGKVARLADVTAPRPLLSARTMAGIGRLGAALLKPLSLQTPIEVQSIEMAECYWYVDARRALSKLGWTFRDPQQTLVDTINDLRSRRI